MKRQRSGYKEPLDFDETIFSPKMDHRVRLPESSRVIFTEKQNFDQIWIWALLGIEMMVMIIPLLLSGQSLWTIAIGVGVMALTMAFLGSLNLTTRIDEDGVHFRMRFFHWKEKTIPWEDIDQIYVRKYSPLGEYGGWGVRYTFNKGIAYNVKGRYGIQIKKKNGKQILLGTQEPEEVAGVLSRHPLLV